MSAEDASLRLSKLDRATKEGSAWGFPLKPDFTAFFAAGKSSAAPIPIPKFYLCPDMDLIYEICIRRAKRGKNRGPEGVPMEILEMCPPVFARVLYEMYKAGARLGCVPRN